MALGLLLSHRLPRTPLSSNHTRFDRCPLPGGYGDANLDGVLSRHDAFFITNFATGITPSACKPQPVGDVTGDGKINQEDLAALQLYLNGTGRLSALEAIAADTNDDGQVTQADLNELLFYVTNNTPLSFARRPL